MSFIDKAKNTAEDALGKAKEVVGDITDNKDLEAEGKMLGAFLQAKAAWAEKQQQDEHQQEEEPQVRHPTAASPTRHAGSKASAERGFVRGFEQDKQEVEHAQLPPRHGEEPRLHASPGGVRHTDAMGATAATAEAVRGRARPPTPPSPRRRSVRRAPRRAVAAMSTMTTGTTPRWTTRACRVEGWGRP